MKQLRRALELPKGEDPIKVNRTLKPDELLRSKLRSFRSQHSN